jgi:arylformamidase
MPEIPAHLYDLDGSSDHANRVQADYVARSEVASDLPGALLDQSYGTDERQRLDVFPAGADAPVLVFFHGGYWRAGSKDSRRFPAIPWREHGVSWVAANYRLAPDNRLEDAVGDARAALVWVAAHANRLGLNGDALHVCGNSAGGHLAAMVAAEGWPGRPAIRSATLVSGLFDMTPLREAAANDWLGLDEARAKALSPVAHPPPPDLPVLLAVGGAETEAFKHQSRLYAEGSCCSTDARDRA